MQDGMFVRDGRLANLLKILVGFGLRCRDRAATLAGTRDWILGRSGRESQQHHLPRRRRTRRRRRNHGLSALPGPPETGLGY